MPHTAQTLYNTGWFELKGYNKVSLFSSWYILVFMSVTWAMFAFNLSRPRAILVYSNSWGAGLQVEFENRSLLSVILFNFVLAPELKVEVSETCSQMIEQTRPRSILAHWMKVSLLSSAKRRPARSLCLAKPGQAMWGNKSCGSTNLVGWQCLAGLQSPIKSSVDGTGKI